MNKDQQKILIGMEVEASEITERMARSEFLKALEKAGRDLEWWNSDVVGARYAGCWHELPAKYRIPNGWRKDFDGSCGTENKFSSPVDSISKAESLVDDLTSWFNNTGLSAFDNAGTHVHLGTLDWITKHIDNVDNVLGRRARSLLYGYFITRERALFQLVPSWRRANSYCTRGIPATGTSMYFPSATSATSVCGVLDKKAPAWAIHNDILAAASTASRFNQGGAIMNGRHLQTFEFRMFPGCGSAMALKGYVRLVWTMFQTVAPLLLEPGALTLKNTEAGVFVTNPLTFTAKDLKSELSDEWLKTWIDETLENDGNPITCDISSSRGPQRLATV